MAAQRRKGWLPCVLTSPKHERECGDQGQTEEIIDHTIYYRSGEVEQSRRGADEFKIMIRIFKRSWGLVRRIRPRIIHAHSPVLNVIPTLIVGLLLRVPVVYEIRAFWEDAGADQGTYTEGSIKYRIVRMLETCCCFFAAHIFVICKGLKDDLVARGILPDKISIIYNAIYPQQYLHAEPDEQFRKKWELSGKKVVGFIGSFYRYEGLDLLVRAFARVIKKQPDAVLLLVGGGETEKELAELVKTLDPVVQQQIVMPGRIPHSQVTGVYALMDVLVYPRYSVRLTELVTPLKPLEAMAMGKSLIASDIGGHRELIKDGINGYLVKANDSEKLADGIVQVLQDENTVRKICEAGRKTVQEGFNWDATTVPYEGIYQSLST